MVVQPGPWGAQQATPRVVLPAVYLQAVPEREVWLELRVGLPALVVAPVRVALRPVLRVAVGRGGVPARGR
jgi:hypothetical protein